MATIKWDETRYYGMKYLELLAPAKNYEQGCEAVNHGADALYIGAPAFGARAAATNSLEDVERLVKYAHLYGAKVFVTINTLLFDHELEPAVELIHDLYYMGVNALIMQDLGLLECDLPPIELHASTQTHNWSVERVKFMEQVGFKRVILARETSLETMRQMREATKVDLEAFVQGALCVCYSGQCYMSQYLNERSGNRGQCGQPCRGTYDLLNSKGEMLRHKEHLLSLKDFNASQHIGSMVDAGITSFKIEGRLKDMGYVKNVTGFYRQLLDNIMLDRKDCRPASDGKTRLYFMPDLERTFNRGFTDYFLEKRQSMASHATQKSLGKYIGKVTKVEKNCLTIKTKEQFTSGDGLCFFGANNELEGFYVNRVLGNTVYPNRMPENLRTGADIWRNNDFAFEKQLQGKSAERKIDADIILSETEDGFKLEMRDDSECWGFGYVDDCEKSAANNPEKAADQIQKQLGKLGETAFVARSIRNECSQNYFIPASVLNELRRQAAENLKEARCMKYHPADPSLDASEWHLEKNDVPYFADTLDYRANIINQKSEQFYRRHGIRELEHGLEETKDYAGKALMTTKYCLRYELKQCLQHKVNKEVGPEYQGPLYLKNNKNVFELCFDCKNCQMQIKVKK